MSVSVDDEGRQAGLWQRWGFIQTRFVSDPGGDTYLKRLGLFDPEERGGIALPGMLVIAPDGTEVSRFEGRDFADRTNDDDLWQTLDSLGLDPIDPRPWEPDVEIPDDLRGFFRPEDLNPYFRGNFFGSIAIGGRLADPESRAIAREHRLMARATLDAFERWTLPT